MPATKHPELESILVANPLNLMFGKKLVQMPLLLQFPTSLVRQRQHQEQEIRALRSIEQYGIDFEYTHSTSLRL